MAHNQRVRLIRKLRDGSTTVEHLPRWLAELVCGEVPYSEPQTASIRIVPEDEPDMRPVAPRMRQSERGMALALYMSSNGSQPFAGQVAH